MQTVIYLSTISEVFKLTVAACIPRNQSGIKPQLYRAHCVVSIKKIDVLCRKGGNLVKRGRVNLIGRLQLATEKSREEDNDGITQLRIFRTQVSYGKLTLDNFKTPA